MGGDKVHRRPPARKRFGQHFLEPAWAHRVVASIGAQPTDAFLEIGPGRGALTLPLAAGVRRLVAIEIDRDLAAELMPHLPANVRLISADALGIDLPQLVAQEFPEVTAVRLAGNLPYNVSAPLLLRMLAWRRACPALTDATVMLQREVAERLVARPGSRDYGALTVFVRMLADASRLLTLPPGAFRPAPKVSSTLVRLTFRKGPVTELGPPQFERMVRLLFAARRKTLLNALKPVAAATGASAVEALAKVGLDPRRRPETLEVTEFMALGDFLAGAADQLCYP